MSLTNGLTAAHSAGLDIVDLAITNGASQTITATTGGTLAMSGDIVFNSFNLTVNNTVACFEAQVAKVHQLADVPVKCRTAREISK